MKLIELYQERAQDFKEQATALQARYERFGFVRLISFIIAIAVLILLYNASPLAGVIATIIFLAAFYRLVQWHQRLLHEKQIVEALALINQQELAFMQDDFQAFSDGKEFIDPAHPNSIDMDIFGPYSFFQYANRTTTAMGKKRLAEYLTTVANASENMVSSTRFYSLQFLKQSSLNHRAHPLFYWFICLDFSLALVPFHHFFLCCILHVKNHFRSSQSNTRTDRRRRKNISLLCLFD